MASASFDLGLSASFVKSSVSSGSTSLRWKSFPLLMRNGSASSRALLMISFVFIRFSLVHTEYRQLGSLVSRRWQKIQRGREYQINHNRQHANEPCGASGCGHQRGCERCEQNHCHCPWPQIQI